MNDDLQMLETLQHRSTLPTSLTGGMNAKPEISAGLWFNPTEVGVMMHYSGSGYVPAFDNTANQFLELRLNGVQEYRIQVDGMGNTRLVMMHQGSLDEKSYESHQLTNGII